MLNAFLYAAVFVALLSSAGAAGQNSSPYDFVSTYIRALDENERIRAQAASELGGSPLDVMSTCIASSRKYDLEISSEISRFRSFDLPGQFKEMPGLFAGLFDNKRITQVAMGEVCERALAGATAGSEKQVSATVGQIAKLRGELEFIDKAIFEGSPMAFLSLLDPQPDAQNRMSRLSITKSQVDALVKQIDRAFGAGLDDPKANYTVSAAKLLRDALTKKGYTPKP